MKTGIDIENKELGINSIDVYNCIDIDVLKRWQAKVKLQIMKIETDISGTKKHRDKGNNIDDDWLNKAEKALNYQKIFISQIYDRILDLDNVDKTITPESVAYYLKTLSEDDCEKWFDDFNDLTIML